MKPIVLSIALAQLCACAATPPLLEPPTMPQHAAPSECLHPQLPETCLITEEFDTARLPEQSRLWLLCDLRNEQRRVAAEAILERCAAWLKATQDVP